MKITLSFIAALIISVFASNLSAITFDIIGPCSKKPAHYGSFETDINESVGKITMDIFDFNKIPYVGSEEGIRSIMSSPIGDEAIEVLSDTKMRAYGWCFSINGVIPDVLSSESFFKSQKDYLSWFYAYSTYDQGVWTDYCVPSYQIKSPQFCK